MSNVWPNMFKLMLSNWTFGYTWIRNIGCRSLVWPFYVLEVKHQQHIQKYVKIWITEGKVHKARQQNIALSLRKLFFTRDQCAHNIRTHKVSSKPSFGTTTRTALQGSKTVLKHGKNYIISSEIWELLDLVGKKWKLQELWRVSVRFIFEKCIYNDDNCQTSILWRMNVS